PSTTSQLANSPQAQALASDPAARSALAGLTAAQSVPITFIEPTLQASVASFNETLVNLGFGREYYLWGSADCSRKECNWRVGWEGGGSYGTCKVDFNEIRHRTDTLGGLFFALSSDLEVPYQCAILQAGIRCQYSYTWTDVLQNQNPGDFQS